MRTRLLNPKLVLVLCLGLWLAGTGRAMAQNTRDAVETLRADLKADRKATIAEAMQMTDSESAAFWPIYDSYRADVDKVNDRVVELVLEYGDLYPNVPEAKATEMLNRYSKAEADLLKVKRKYLKKFGKVLPPSKVFRFAQLDNRFDLGTRVGLAAAVPLMPGAPAQAQAQPTN